ncbi:VWA domain-containing protein [Angustibacter speluncae]
MTTAAADVDVLLLGFGRALAAAGVAVTPDRAQSFVRAVDELGADPASVYWAGRSTLCGQPDDLPVYDRVFETWFAGHRPRRGTRSHAPVQRSVEASLDDARGGGTGEQLPEPELHVLASATEVLRHRDIADLSADDKARLDALFAGLTPRLPTRPSARRRPAAHGEVDARALLREQLRRAGEVGPVRYRRRGRRPRPVVLLVDVSGSMSPYADALLRLGHLLVRASRSGRAGRVEVFTIGTRLTRLTPVLRRVRSAPAALDACGHVVPDWSGGTRLGEVLAAFVDRWGRRGVARGAVVVICSDGWERGDTARLADQVEHLARLAHRVVWVNPHRGKAGYQPVQAGIAAVLPHLDDFVAGHSLAAFDELLAVVAGA